MFLVFSVVTFLLGRYDFAAANFLSAVGFGISEFRFHIIVRLKLQHKWERTLRRGGDGLGYLGIAVLFVMMALKVLK